MDLSVRTVRTFVGLGFSISGLIVRSWRMEKKMETQWKTTKL